MSRAFVAWLGAASMVWALVMLINQVPLAAALLGLTGIFLLAISWKE